MLTKLCLSERTTEFTPLASYPQLDSMATAVAVGAAEVNKCPACCKSVFRAEEVPCGGSFWHKTCIRCGGNGVLGCQRQLLPTNVSLHSSMPYCKPCYAKLHVKVTLPPEGEGADTIQAATSGSARSELPELQGVVKISDMVSTYGSPKKALAGSGTPSPAKVTCPKCLKTVYKMEEVRVTGSVWHKACFRCGGANIDGSCGKLLGHDNYHLHKGNPFCATCYSKQQTEMLTPKKADILNASASVDSTEFVDNGSSFEEEKEGEECERHGLSLGNESTELADKGTGSADGDINSAGAASPSPTEPTVTGIFPVPLTPSESPAKPTDQLIGGSSLALIGMQV